MRLQVVIRALSENPALIDFGLVPRALLGLLALLCGNGYIVGINQVRTARHAAGFGADGERHSLTPWCYRFMT